MFSKSCAMCHLTCKAPQHGVPGWAAPLTKEQIRHAERESRCCSSSRSSRRPASARCVPSLAVDEVRVRVLDLVELIRDSRLASAGCPDGTHLIPPPSENANGVPNFHAPTSAAALEIGRHADSAVHERNDAAIAALPGEVERDPDVRHVDRPRRIRLHDASRRRATRIDDRSLRRHVRELRCERSGTAKPEIVAHAEHRPALQARRRP